VEASFTMITWSLLFALCGHSGTARAEHERDQRILSLVAQLGHTNYHRREAAQRALLQQGDDLLAVLAARRPEKDLEVALRLRRIRTTLFLPVHQAADQFAGAFGRDDVPGMLKHVELPFWGPRCTDTKEVAGWFKLNIEGSHGSNSHRQPRITEILSWRQFFKKADIDIKSWEEFKHFDRSDTWVALVGSQTPYEGREFLYVLVLRLTKGHAKIIAGPWCG